MQLASVDGVIGPAEAATIPISDEGFTRGDGAFEATRLYGGQPYALEDHLARLERSLAGIRLSADLDALRAEIDALLELAPPRDGVLRMFLTRGGRRIVLTEPLPARPDAVRLATVVYAPNRVLDGLKTLSYAGNMLSKRIAQERGADDALLVTPHGRILESSTSSFFWVRAGALYTPPLEDRILASITRSRILEECDVAEEPCTLADLAAAEEAFVASSVREVVPVIAVDDQRLSAGPVTRAAHEALSRRISRDLEDARRTGSPSTR
jgi:branched-chain amino acid aminotransferase